MKINFHRKNNLIIHLYTETAVLQPWCNGIGPFTKYSVTPFCLKANEEFKKFSTRSKTLSGSTNRKSKFLLLGINFSVSLISINTASISTASFSLVYVPVASCWYPPTHTTAYPKLFHTTWKHVLTILLACMNLEWEYLPPL